MARWWKLILEARRLKRTTGFDQMTEHSSMDIGCKRCMAVVRTIMSDAALDGSSADSVVPFPAAVCEHLAECTACVEDFLWCCAAQATSPEDASSTALSPGERWSAGSSPGPAHRDRAAEWVSVLMEAIHHDDETMALHLTPRLISLLEDAVAVGQVRAASGGRYDDTLFMVAPQALWPHAITAYRDSMRETMSLVEIEVSVAGRDWPDLAGIQVSVSTASQRWVRQTDAWGVAACENVPTSELLQAVIEVRRVS